MKQPAAGTVDKALAILFYLHEAAEAQGVTALARALAMPKANVHRLLSALARRSLVEQDAQGRYRPGVALIALGLGALAREPVATAARPVLEAAAAAVGETFFLVVARAGRLIVLDKAEGNGFLRAAPQLGSEVPVHATAAGKLYLAYAPELLTLPAALTPFTAHTLPDQAALEQAVTEAKQRGWAENREEWQPGLTVLAAPVRVGGRLLAVVALAGAAARVTELGSEQLARRVVDAAERIAARLGGLS